jgi:hypothetical protein
MFELEDFTSKAGDSTVERGGALGENNDPLNLTFPAPPIGDEKWAGRSFTGFPTTKYLKNPAWRAVFSDITAADLAQIPRIVAHRASVHERFGQIFAQPFYLHSVFVTPTKGANGEK